MKNLELSDTASLEAHALLLKVISAGFLYPDIPWMERFGLFLDEVGEEVESIRDAYLSISLDDLQSEYFRLFGPSPTCPLEIGFHLSDNPFMQAGTMAQMAGYYRIFGVDSPEGMRPDHLSLCLEFLSFLYLKKANALRKGLVEAQDIVEQAIQIYIRDFLDQALESFSTKLHANSTNEFYRHLASLAVQKVWQAQMCASPA